LSCDSDTETDSDNENLTDAETGDNDPITIKARRQANIDMSDVIKDGDRTVCVADRNFSDAQRSDTSLTEYGTQYQLVLR